MTREVAEVLASFFGLQIEDNAPLVGVIGNKGETPLDAKRYPVQSGLTRGRGQPG